MLMPSIVVGIILTLNIIARPHTRLHLLAFLLGLAVAFAIAFSEATGASNIVGKQNGFEILTAIPIALYLSIYWRGFVRLFTLGLIIVLPCTSIVAAVNGAFYISVILMGAAGAIAGGIYAACHVANEYGYETRLNANGPFFVKRGLLE